MGLAEYSNAGQNKQLKMTAVLLRGSPQIYYLPRQPSLESNVMAVLDVSMIINK